MVLVSNVWVFHQMDGRQHTVVSFSPACDQFILMALRMSETKMDTFYDFECDCI